MYYPDDIAKTLSALTGADKALLEDALYYLKYIAGNPLNCDCYRVLYRSLLKLAEKHDCGEISCI